MSVVAKLMGQKAFHPGAVAAVALFAFFVVPVAFSGFWVRNVTQTAVFGIVAASDEEKARARKVATLASRTNFVLSIPMLLCMGSATHGLPF